MAKTENLNNSASNLNEQVKGEKIEIKHIEGNVIYSHEVIDNNIKITLYEAIKAVADLRGADLRYANMRYADFSGANLSGANLRGADLRGANLSGANLSGADLSCANLRYANLSDANLSGADLRYTDLRYADLRYADLSGADLRYADLRYADLSGADLSDADLSDADLNFLKSEKRFITIGSIGSIKRQTTYCFEDDIIWCGCFKNNLEAFVRKVEITHDKNSIHYKEYMGVIKLIKSLQ